MCSTASVPTSIHSHWMCSAHAQRSSQLAARLAVPVGLIAAATLCRCVCAERPIPPYIHFWNVPRNIGAVLAVISKQLREIPALLSVTSWEDDHGCRQTTWQLLMLLGSCTTDNSAIRGARNHAVSTCRRMRRTPRRHQPFLRTIVWWPCVPRADSTHLAGPIYLSDTFPTPGYRRNIVKAILLAAIAVLSIGVSCADARARDTAAATGTDSGSTSVSASGLPTPPPSRTIGGVGIRVWTPVAPPYNAEANGDLAARNIWGE